MRKRSRKTAGPSKVAKFERRRDVNQMAAASIRRAMELGDAPSEKLKNPHAVALGRKGGQIGGKRRAANMTASERSNAARAAVMARWAKIKREPPS